MPAKRLPVLPYRPGASPRSNDIRTLADHPFLAAHLGRAPCRGATGRSIAPFLLGAAMLTAIVRLTTTPTPIDGLLTVGLAGVTAWQAAMATSRVPSVRRSAANDNPQRPCLPLPSMW